MRNSDARHCPGCSDGDCPGLYLDGILLTLARPGPFPLSMGEETVLREFLATLEARCDPGKASLWWREERDGYTQEWYCEPPPQGAGFRVRPGNDDWTEEGGFPVRRIYAIEVIDAAAQQAVTGQDSRPGSVRAAHGTGAWPGCPGPARPPQETREGPGGEGGPP